VLPILKLLTPTIIKAISKYVFEENDLDRKVKELEDTLDRVRERLIKLEKPQ